VDEILDHYHGVALGALDVNAVAADLFGALNRNNVHPPPQLVLLLKTLVMQEAIGRKLDPGLDLIECAKPYIGEILARRYSAQRLGGLAADAGLEYVDLARVFPGELRDLATRLRTGRQRLVIQHDDLDTIRRELERSSSRITLGLVVGALTLASSLLLAAHVEPTLWGASALGLLGLLGAGIGGFWLIVGILRSGRY
jgi:ubiquinone biosynthesis protein